MGEDVRAYAQVATVGAAATGARGLSDGPVGLWIDVYSDDGALMGSGRCADSAGWLWRDGRLCVAYGDTEVPIIVAGHIDHALLTAVQHVTRIPVIRVPIDYTHRCEPNEQITVAGGTIAISPSDGYEP